jgi:hypothetical protein
MPTERVNPNKTSTRFDSRHRSLPLHFNSRYEIVSVPTTGKPRCSDIILMKRSAKGSPFKQASEIVRAWRARTDGQPRDEALAAAHKLRDELDESLAVYKPRVVR